MGFYTKFSEGLFDLSGAINRIKLCQKPHHLYYSPYPRTRTKLRLKMLENDTLWCGTYQNG